MSEKPKCCWVKSVQVDCRFPKIKELSREADYRFRMEGLLGCICCLFGWHLELSELKVKRRKSGNGQV
jgi:hypothetical protein